MPAAVPGPTLKRLADLKRNPIALQILPPVAGLAACAGVAWFRAFEPGGGAAKYLSLQLAGVLVFALVAAWRARTAGGEFGGERDRPVGRVGSAWSVALGLALCTAAMAAAVQAEFGSYASASLRGDSPHLTWLYCLLGLGFSAYWLLSKAPIAERAAMAMALFALANGKFWTRNTELFWPLFAALAGCALCTPAGATASQEAAGHDSKRREQRLYLLAAAFLLWTALCGWLGDYPGRADELVGRMASGAVAGYLILRHLNSNSIGRLLSLLGLAGLTAVCVIPAAMEALEIVKPTQYLASRLRLFGLHPNLTGTFLAVHLVIAVALLREARGTLRAGLCASILIATPALYLCRSRTGWLAALVGLFAMALVRRLSLRTWVAMTALGAAATAMVFFVEPVREAIMRPATSGQSLHQRLYLWDAAAELTAEEPIFGIGPGNYFAHGRSADSPSYYDGTDKTLHPHNLMLSVSEGTGLIGLGLFATFLFLLFLHSLRAAGNEGSRGRLGTAVFAGAAALFAGNMLDLGLSQTSFVPTLAWILAACACVLSRAESASTPAMEPQREGGRPAAYARACVALALCILAGVRPLLGEGYLARGAEHQKAGRNKLALLAFERAQKFQPLHVGAPHRAAQIHAEQRQNAKAEELFLRAIELAPRHARFRYRYAVFLNNLARPAEAREQCALALELDPHSPDEGDFRCLHAETLARLGLRSEALAEFGRTIEVSPSLPSRFAANNWIVPVDGEAPIDLLRLAQERAAVHLERAAQLLPYENRRLGNHIARIFKQLGRADLSRAHLLALEQASGRRDASLIGLMRELAAAEGQALRGVGDVAGAGEAGAATQAGSAQRWDQVARLAGERIEAGAAEEVYASALSDLSRARMDIYFDDTSWRDLFEALYLSAVAGAHEQEWRRAAQGVLYFSTDSKRQAFALKWAKQELAQGDGELALKACAQSLAGLDDLDRPEDRERQALELARLANRACANLSAQEFVQRVGDFAPADSGGAGRRLFRIYCLLDRAGSEPALESSARTEFEALRRERPFEGPWLAQNL